MKVIGKDILYQFVHKHAEAKGWIETWLKEVEYADWNNTHDIKKRYRKASILKNNLVIFDVKGNKYRLVCRIGYNVGVVNIVWVGKHSEYSKFIFV